MGVVVSGFEFGVCAYAGLAGLYPETLILSEVEGWARDVSKHRAR